MKQLINIKIIVFVIIIIFSPAWTYSQSQQVPLHIQAAFFGKIFNHISPLKEINPIKILIMYNNKTESDKTVLMQSLEDLGFIVEAAQPFKLVMNISDFNVIFFMSDTQSYAKLCRESKVLSICGNPDYVEEGNISIAIGVEQDKPKVHINLGVLQSEKKDVSAALLRISTVYR